MRNEVSSCLHEPKYANYDQYEDHRRLCFETCTCDPAIKMDPDATLGTAAQDGQDPNSATATIHPPHTACHDMLSRKQETPDAITDPQHCVGTMIHTAEEKAKEAESITNIRKARLLRVKFINLADLKLSDAQKKLDENDEQANYRIRDRWYNAHWQLLRNQSVNPIRDFDYGTYLTEHNRLIREIGEIEKARKRFEAQIEEFDKRLQETS